MAFDIAGARRAGYSDQEIVDHLSQSREFDVGGAMSAGYSIGEIADHMGGMNLDDTTLLGSIGEAGKRFVGGVGTGLVRVGTGLAELIPGVDDEAAREVQQDVDEFVADKLAYDPAYDENYGAQLGEVVGEMVPMVASLFIPGGAAARATQLATMIGPAVSEGGMDRAEYEERTGEGSIYSRATHSQRRGCRPWYAWSVSASPPESSKDCLAASLTPPKLIPSSVVWSP